MPANVMGGRSWSPTLMASQVEPQMRQSPIQMPVIRHFPAIDATLMSVPGTIAGIYGELNE